MSKQEEIILMANNEKQDEIVKSTGGKVLDIAKQFPKDKFNRLTPTDTIMEISPLQRVTVEVLTISTDPDDGEIFKIGTKKVGDRWQPLYALTKPSLDRITHALGISWIPRETKRTDDRSDPNIVEFTAVGVYKKPDGSIETIMGTKEIDLTAEEEEMRIAAEEKAMNGNLWINKQKMEYGTPECDRAIDFQVRKAINTKRKFKMALAESGAKNRAVRSMGLKSKYLLQDLQKPFIVPRVNFDPSALMNDPQAKKMLLDNAMSSAKQLYGDTPKIYANGDDTTIEASFEETPPEQPTAEDIAEMNENTPQIVEGSENGEAEPEESKLTDNQRKAIFAQARQFWVEDSDEKLHSAIKDRYNKVSVNDLTEAEAKEIIAGLNSKLQETTQTTDDLVSTAMSIWSMEKLATVENLNEIVKKRYRVDAIDNLTPKQIGLVIGRIEEGKDKPVLATASADDDDLPF